MERWRALTKKVKYIRRCIFMVYTRETEAS